MDNQEKSLYERLVEEGIPTDHHYSDLYFKKTEESMAILNNYPTLKKQALHFQHSGTKEMWIDVPFAFEPFWEKRQ